MRASRSNSSSRDFVCSLLTLGGLAAGLSGAAAHGADAAELTLATTAHAAEPAAEAPADVAGGEPGSRLAFKFGADYTTAYYFRGIRQEDRGFIIQPYAEMGFDLISTDEGSLTLIAGIWNSFHDHATGATNNSDLVDKWYEADLYAGLAGSIGDFSLGMTYIYYTSPNGAFSTIQELDFSVGYDDSSHWGDSTFAINPSVVVAIETAGANADGGMNRGVYIQPGIAPGFTAAMGPLGDVAFSFPIAVGLSLSDYFENAGGGDETFGYASVGAKAAFQLPMPEEFGVWSLTGGVQVLFLGDSTKAINGGDDSEVIGSVGLLIEF